MVLFEKDNLSRSFIEIVFQSRGSIYAKKGVAYFCAHLLNTKGTLTKKEKFYQKLEEDAIELNVSVNREFFTISLKFLNSKEKSAINALKELLLNPNFSQESFEKSKKEFDGRIKKLSRLIGGIGNNQGDVAEEFFYNSLSHKPSLGGIDYDFIYKNITKRQNNIEDEYDMLLVNGKDVAIIETKYKAHSNDLDRLINKKYSNFKKLYPEYKDYNHHLGLASFKINDNLKKEALSNNIMILQRKGEVIETILP